LYIVYVYIVYECELKKTAQESAVVTIHGFVAVVNVNCICTVADFCQTVLTEQFVDNLDVFFLL